MTFLENIFAFIISLSYPLIQTGVIIVVVFLYFRTKHRGLVFIGLGEFVHFVGHVISLIFNILIIPTIKSDLISILQYYNVVSLGVYGIATLMFVIGLSRLVNDVVPT